MSHQKTMLAALFLLTLCACTTLPPAAPFPEPPAVLMTSAPELKTLPENAQLSDVLTTVTENYQACHETAQILTSLQYWISLQKQIADEAADK